MLADDRQGSLDGVGRAAPELGLDRVGGLDESWLSIGPQGGYVSLQEDESGVDKGGLRGAEDLFDGFES